MKQRAVSRSPLARWLASPPPAAAVEIAVTRVTAIAVAQQGAARVVTAHATEPLPAGAVEPALNAPNLHDPAKLTAAIDAALDRLSPRPRRIALVLPDTVAKISLVRFEKVPVRTQDLDQLIRWQVRKSVPFRIEDAQVAWLPGTELPAGGREFLVSVARRDVIESYEHACAAAGAYAGIVDLASLNLINAVLAGQGDGATPGDWLLVHVVPAYATLAVVRGSDVIFLSNRAAGEDADLADLVHQTAMYHEDRLGGGRFSRLIVAGASSLGVDRAERLRRQLEERTGTRSEPVDFRGAAALRDRVTAGPEVLDALAPALGVIVREYPAPRQASERVA
jgi:type IV pilus assembly protein PilM